MPVLKFKNGTIRPFNFDAELVARLIRLSENRDSSDYAVALDKGLPEKVKKQQNDQVQVEYARLWLEERCRS